MSADTVERLREHLAALQPQSLAIRDDSHRHAGHAGARNGGGHYHVDIVAEAFTGQNTLARHRLVMAAAGELMQGAIHALSISARAPGEV